jgi:hypothetical protein
MALSEKTIAEMRAGAKRVGTSPAALQYGITGAEAWRKADEFEKEWNRSSVWNAQRNQWETGKFSTRLVHVQCIAARDAEDKWWVHTNVTAVVVGSITNFEPEPAETFPSEKLRTQIMLVLG